MLSRPTAAEQAKHTGACRSLTVSKWVTGEANYSADAGRWDFQHRLKLPGLPGEADEDDQLITDFNHVYWAANVLLANLSDTTDPTGEVSAPSCMPGSETLNVHLDVLQDLACRCRLSVCRRYETPGGAMAILHVQTTSDTSVLRASSVLLAS